MLTHAEVKDWIHARIEIEDARHGQRAATVTLAGAAALGDRLTAAMGARTATHLAAHIATCVSRARGTPETRGAQDTLDALREALGPRFDLVAQYADVAARLHVAKAAKRSTALQRVTLPATLRARSMMAQTGRG